MRSLNPKNNFVTTILFTKEMTMKNHPDNSEPLEPRYFVNLAVRNILNRQRVDFLLFRPELDDNLIHKVAEDSGFTPKHSNFSELEGQIKCSFTLEEISQFIGRFGKIKILEVNIEFAAYIVHDLQIPRKGQLLLTVYTDRETFDFSTVEGYSASYEIKGYYDPH
jgi:hypothetical protein